MRRLISGFILIVFVWMIGLIVFIGQLPRPADGAPAPSDGVVVFTGGGARISAGMEIFAGGAGQSLLISGVHPGVSREKLAELWPGTSEQFDCCVDLGREAQTTEGNAREVDEWAGTRNYSSLILVTSDYHMPRAVAATKARMPDAVITPYAVASGYLNDAGRPASLEAWRKLAGEYTKFLLARVKAFFSTLGA